MKAFTFIEAATVAEASAESARAGSRLIAGGSDLLGELKEGSAQYQRLVSLAGIAELRGVSSSAGGLRIGALTTISDLTASGVLTGPYRMLADAARSVATPEIRNQGTLGGNLCQRPRCLHFRHALVGCLKKGGAGCPAVETPYQSYLSIFGGPGCYAVHPSDLAPALIALDAIATIEGPSGRRDLPLASFFTGPDVDPTRENILAPGEVLTGVLVPAAAGDWRGLYSKSRTRTAGDFAIASLALGFQLRDGRMSNVRVVLGGVAPVPRRSTAAEAALEGKAPSETVAAAAAEAAVEGAAPMEHSAFKLDLVRASIRRGVLRLAST